MIKLRDSFYCLKNIHLGLESGNRGRENKLCKFYVFLSVCIIFTVNELIPVYYFFLEVKQLELVIYSNGSNENS